MSGILAHRRFLQATVTNFFFFSSLNGFVLLPLHIQQLGGTEIEIGVVMGLYSAMGILCQPLIGPWVDAVGRKPFMVFGAALVLLSALLAMAGGSLPALAGIRLLQGVGFSAFFVANYSYVIDLVPAAQRGWALGIYGVSGLMSTALAPLVGEVIIRRLGFRPFFAACAGLAAVAVALVWRVREQPRGGPRLVRGWAWAWAGLEDIFHRHMAVTVFFGLGAGAIFTFLPTFGEELGVTTLALFYTAYAGAAMGVRVFGGRLIDTRGRRAVIVPSMFAQAVSTALLAGLGLLVSRTSQVPVVPVLFVAGLVSGGAHGFMYPGLAALVADQASETRRGAVVGVFSAVFLAGHAGGAFVFGYVTHAIGYGLMWSALTAVLLAGAGLSLRLTDRAGPA
ncbi:MAG: MFS transporter [Candidatus Rokubacteria bacterium]|nr:MFS transporter [Candidatus Rokubacteria bacterium]